MDSIETAQKTNSLWRNRDYLLLWSGQTVSNIGSGASEITFPLLALLVTHSVVQTGFISAVRMLIYVLCVLPAGALVDRWDRKQVMICCDIGRAVALASIPVAFLLGYISVLQLYVVTLIDGSLDVFFDIAEIACLPQVVSKEQLSTAMGNTQASTGIMTLLGPPLGGALFALRAMLPFLVDALSYGVSSCSLLLMRVRFQEERSVVKHNLRAEMVEGIRWLWRQPLLRSLALLTGASNFMAAGYVLLIVVLAQAQHASSTVVGLIFGFGGAGSILGALLAKQFQRYFRFGQIIAGCLWLFALLWVSLMLLPSPFLLGIVTTLIWFVSPIYNVTYVGYRLSMVPDALQGRVNSVARLISFGSRPAGLALTGILLQYYGPVWTVGLSVAGQLLVALVATLNTHLRYASSRVGM